MQKNENIKMAVYNLGGLKVASTNLGISKSAICKWIRKGKIPNINMAKRVAEESGFSLESLRPIYEQKVSQ